MKRILSSVLAFLMVLSCFAGTIVLNVSAEGEASEDFVVSANTLATTGAGVHALNITLEEEGGEQFCRYTVLGGDPYVWYNELSSSIANYQYMEVTYRTSSDDNPIGAYFMNTTGYDFKEFPYVVDGQWHTVIVDLTQNSQWTPNMSQFRFDPQTAGSAAGGGIVDYKQVRFFNPQRVYWNGDNALTEVFYDGGAQPGSGLYFWTAGNGWGVGPFYIGVGNGRNVALEYSIDGGNWINSGATFDSWERIYGQPDGQWTAICEASVPHCAGSDPDTSLCMGYQIPAISQLDAGTHMLSVRVVTDRMEYAQWDYELQVMDIAAYVATGYVDYNWTGTEKVAIRYNVPYPTRYLMYEVMATYAGAGKSFEIKTYQWDTDYATTVAAEPIATNIKTNIGDNVICSVDLGATVEGDVLFEYTPLEGTFTTGVCAVGANSEVYVNGAKQGYELAFRLGYVSDKITDYDFTQPGTVVQANSTEGTDATFFGKAKRFGVKEYDGFAKLYQTAGGEPESYMTAPMQAICCNDKFAAIVYRTTSPSAKFQLLVADAAGNWSQIGQYGYNPGEMNTSGEWTYCFVPLTFPANGITYYPDLRVDFIDGGVANDYVDIAAIRLYKSAYDALDDMDAYRFKDLNKDQYIYRVEEKDEKITYFEGAQGNPSTQTAPFGFKFDVVLDTLTAVEITNMATYGNGATTGVAKLWAWDTDLNTTKAAEPIATFDIANHPDCGDLKIDVSDKNLGKGTYYFECQVTDGNWTPWDSTGALNGATCYIGGSEHPFRCSTYQHGVGETNICIGDPSTTAVTYEIDFSHYSDAAVKEYGFTNANSIKVPKTLTDGYAHFEVTGGDPFVMLANCTPTTYTNLAKYAVVKYRTDADGVFQFFHNRKDGYGMGQAQDPTFPVIGDGEWRVALADLSIDGWANVLGGEFTAFRIDGCNSGSTYFDISYIKFYANLEPAQAQYESELTSRTDRVTIPAKNVITIKEPVEGHPERDVEYDLADIDLTYSNIDGGVLKTSWPDAGYPEGSAMMDLGWNNFGYMGELDLSKYSKATIWITSDTSMPANNVAGLPAIVGFKADNSSFGWADQTGYQLATSIAYGEIGAANDPERISPSGRGAGGWADAERKVEIDLSDVDYSGHVWLTSFSIQGYRTDNGQPVGYGMLVTKVVFTEPEVEAVAGEFAGVPDCDYELRDGEYYVPAIVNEYAYAPVDPKYTSKASAANGFSVEVDEEFLVNGVALNDDDVSASAWVKEALGSKYLDKKNNVDTITFKGWIGNLKVAAFGYAIDGNDAIFDEAFIAGTDDDIKAEGGPNAVYYNIVADVTGLTEGSFNITPVVKTTDGSVFALDAWGSFNYQVGKQTYKVCEDWHKVTFVNGELIEVPYEATAADYTATTDPVSYDTLIANGVNVVDDGHAFDKLAELGGVHNEDYSVANFGLRGWYGSPANGAIECFGYALNDGDPIWGDFKQATEDAVKTAAGTDEASRYCVTIDTTKLPNGCYNVYVLAKHTNGVVVKFANWDTVLYQGKQTYTVPGDCYFYYEIVHDDIAKTPIIPINPADVTGYVYFDGPELYTGTGVQTTEATYVKDGAYTHLVATGGDSQYYMFLGTEYELGNYLAIKYRTDKNMLTEGFIGVGAGATGAGDHYDGSLIGDEAWHIVVINLSGIIDGKANYFRFDFIANATGEMDVQWLGFFQNEADIDTFDKLIWTAPVYYTATFVNEAGEVVKAIDYKAGAEKLTGIPKVPAKEGFDGVWEEYTLNGNITIKPVYTAKPVEEETTPEETTAGGEEPEVPQLKDKKIFDVWTEGAIKGVFATGGNQTEVSVNDDGVNFHWTGVEGEAVADPYVTFNLSKYIKTVGGDVINGQETYIIVLKVKTLNEDGAFEIFAKPAEGENVAVPYEGKGEWEYLTFDMYDTSLSDTKKVTSLRFDWSTGEPSADLTIGAIAFFATEAEADAYINGGSPVVPGDDTTAEETTAVEAETTAAAPVDTTAEGTSAETTAAAEEGGCCSVLGLGAVALVAVLGAGYVVIKKKKD